MLEKINTILFDLDGTLIDSVPDMSAAVNATMCELGRPGKKTFVLLAKFMMVSCLHCVNLKKQI